MEHLKVIQIRKDGVFIDGVKASRETAKDIRRRFEFDQQIYQALRCPPMERRLGADSD